MNNSKDLINLAKKLYEDKKFFDAKLNLLRALNSNNLSNELKIKLYVLLADVCEKINELDNAEKYLLKYLDQDGKNLKILNSLANIYLKKRQFKKSETFFLNAIKVDENNESSLIGISILYENFGKQNQAQKFYKKVLEINPKNFAVIYNLSKIDKNFVDEKLLNFISKNLNQENLDYLNKASGYFLLAQHERYKRNFDNELEHLKKAHQYAFKSKETYNNQLLEYWLNIIPNKICNLNLSNNKIKDNKKSFFPIFIIGLPRSGSTLVESIISSGKIRIDNLSETNLVNWSFLSSNKNTILKSKIDEKIDIDINLISQRLLNSFQNLNILNTGKKLIFIEKSLENFFFIELILNIFPNAKFINPNRNYIDNIFAIYTQFLNDISWSHSLENILIYIDNYIQIIEYFKKKYQDKIFSFYLEELTNKPEQVSKEIFDFCELKWDKKCLEFHKRKDFFSKTASNNQIRANLKKYDEKKYQSYKEILKNYSKQYDWLNLK